MKTDLKRTVGQEELEMHGDKEEDDFLSGGFNTNLDEKNNEYFIRKDYILN